MITVRLIGGMGNQMFQYAFAKSLSVQKGVEFSLDVRYLKDRTPLPNFVFRDFDLDIFEIDYNLFEGRKLFPFEVYVDKIWTYIINANIFQKKYYTETSFDFDKSYMKLPDNIYCIGYFQSYKYFEPIKDILFKQFTIKDQMDTISQLLLNKITTENSICVNFRRGDFLTKSAHNILDNDYYTNAIELLAKKVDSPQFYIFSDDIDWCKQNVNLSYPTTFVTEDYYGIKYKGKFQLMKSCKHFIIPNSTFAWWAAYLAQNKNKIVVAPKYWLKNKEFKDIIPEEWFRI